MSETANQKTALPYPLNRPCENQDIGFGGAPSVHLKDARKRLKFATATESSHRIPGLLKFRKPKSGD